MGVTGAAVAASRNMPEPIAIYGSLFSIEKINYLDEFRVTSKTHLANGKILRLHTDVSGDDALDESGPGDSSLAHAALRLGAVRLERRIDLERMKAAGKDPFVQLHADPLIDAAIETEKQRRLEAERQALEALPDFGLF